jgi:hypothetical protein
VIVQRHIGVSQEFDLSFDYEDCVWFDELFKLVGHTVCGVYTDGGLVLYKPTPL